MSETKQMFHSCLLNVQKYCTVHTTMFSVACLLQHFIHDCDRRDESGYAICKTQFPIYGPPNLSIKTTD